MPPLKTPHRIGRPPRTRCRACAGTGYQMKPRTVPGYSQPVNFASPCADCRGTGAVALPPPPDGKAAAANDREAQP